MNINLKYEIFQSRKYIWLSCLRNGGHFISALMCLKGPVPRYLGTLGTLMTQNCSIQISTILLGKHAHWRFGTDDVGSKVGSTLWLVWADVILADFQRAIFRCMQNISTYLSCTTQRVLRTPLMQKSKPKHACIPSQIVEVWIDRFRVRCDWWRRLSRRHQCSQCVRYTINSDAMGWPMSNCKSLKLKNAYMRQQNSYHRFR